jgi:arsenate reductase-like glutaredoxin family protein
MTYTSGVSGEKKCSQSRALIRSLEQDLNSPSCEIVSATPLQRGELWKIKRESVDSSWKCRANEPRIQATSKE